MTLPYGITYDSVTKDLGNLATKNGPRKVDVQLYNGHLLIPGIVYHLSSKTKSIRVNELFGRPFEVNVINFIARYKPIGAFGTDYCLRFSFVILLS